MGFGFDDAAAARLAACAAQAALALRGSAWPRRSAAEAALRDFDGGYVRLFETARTVEYEDRVRLAHALDDLADQVRIARHQASQERHRRSELAAWRKQAADREHTLVGIAAAWEPLLDASAAAFDPEPTAAPIRPTPVTATFRARHRRRTGAQATGRSSADPERLRRFTATAQAQDGVTEQDLVRVRNAWAGFRDRCGWVPVEAPPLPGGFGAYLDENAEDARWAARIADAFEAAGGRSVSDVALDIAGVSTLSPAARRLLEPSLTPAEVAAAWTDLGLTAEDIAVLPLRTQVQVANLDGLPAVARDVASRRVLAAALRDPERMYRLFGLAYTYGAVSLEEFTTQVRALAQGLQRADRIAADLPAPTATVAQLVGFGVANGAPVAAVVLGDLDTAANVTVNVPGATTTLGSTLEKAQAASGLLRSAARARKTDSYAVVSWFGYRAPAFPEVPAQGRAAAGGAELASFLDGIHDSRGGAPRRFTVLGHSYGSTTAAEALAQTRHLARRLRTPSRRSSLPEYQDEDHAIASCPRSSRLLRLAPHRVHQPRRPHASRCRRSDRGRRGGDVDAAGVRPVRRALRADAGGPRGSAASGTRRRVVVDRRRPGSQHRRRRNRSAPWSRSPQQLLPPERSAVVACWSDRRPARSAAHDRLLRAARLVLPRADTRSLPRGPG
ncbi:alpha/beta hydrolase [Curtobacterium sp. MCBA15_004]|uniref:alpha/beta hydrolase n=1 Tax=Curtobacterium sp. MCBA15_004 TaxID=1898733 RepID=UPI0009F2014E|nr:alpha/beta hydrolase [Curtobacterium sp. MCBA15_004]WIA96218.1 alpha/beta hydrolase [Curtobacterium sp. MCBA15_004]